MDLDINSLITFLVGGGGATILTLMRERGRVRAYTLGVVDAAVKTAMEALQGTIGTLEGEIKRTQLQHKECQKDLFELRNNIDKLMKGEIANYGDKPPL